MLTSEMLANLAVRTTRDIELFPYGVFPAGTIGAVQLTGGDGIIEPFCVVKLEREYPSLRYWENGLLVWVDETAGITAADFEMVKGI